MKQTFSTLHSFYFKINLFITIVLSLLFLQFNTDYTITSFLFTLATLISTTATLYLIYYLLFRILFRFKISYYFLSLVFTMTNIVLLLDFAIYRIWKFHINGMVLNILFSPEAYKSLYMTSSSLFIIIFVIVSLLLSQIILYRKLTNIDQNKLKNLNKKLNIIVSILFLLIIIIEKLIYGFANFYGNTALLERTKVTPLYLPLTMDRFLMRKLSLEKPKNNQITMHNSKITNINYPLHPIKINNIEKPNIFIFGIDALRRQSITQSTTPNIQNFKNESINFSNNISGGNNTRFGLFSIFYGINSSYWFGFLNAQKGSILFDVLKELHYKISIISSVTFEWPEFRKTAFNNVQNFIKDDFKGNSIKTDQDVIQYFSQWIDKQKKDEPIFSFLWLNSLHGALYPDKFKKFLPDNVKNNYLTLTKKEKVQQLNRYKNSALYVDSLFKVFIEKLKEKHLYKNSIIILLSDHGQEFFEKGNFGHNSSYNEYQVGAPLIIHMPNTSPKTVQTMSSHLDIVPTLMHILGVENPTSDYAHGHNLFDPNYHRECTFIGNWNENAIVCNKYTLSISNIVSRSFNNKVYDTKTYTPLEDYNQSYVNKAIMQFLQENKQFTK